MNRVRPSSGWGFLLAVRPSAYTWSPASGCHGDDCEVYRRGVCWAQRIVKRLGHICPLCPTFKPHLHPERLDEPLKVSKPSVIAPVPTGDLFGQHVGDILEILRIIREAPWHIFAIVTKLPAVASLTSYPRNVMFGVTVNNQEDTWRLDSLRRVRASYKWAIFEPLYGPIDYDLTWLDWIITGPQNRPSLQPQKDWLDLLLRNAKEVPVFMKSGLAYEPKLRQGPRLEDSV